MTKRVQPPGKIIATLGAFAVEAIEGPGDRHYLISREGKRLGVPTSRDRALKALADRHPHGNTQWTKWNREARAADRAAKAERQAQRRTTRQRIEEADLAEKIATTKDELGKVMADG